MNVLVASPVAGSPAHYALLTEGEVHGEHILGSRTAYGDLWADTWDEGEPFVMIEWDIILAPGQLRELCECREPWCSFRYPIPGPGEPILGMGIAKVKPQGPAPDEWRSTVWERLDGQVVPLLRELYHHPHEHTPAVAHARRP